MCMCGWDLQLGLCPCIFDEYKGDMRINGGGGWESVSEYV